MSGFFFVLVCLGCAGLGFVLRGLRDRPRITLVAEASAPAGYSVEVDCRACGQVNRVPSERFLKRPICGRCKQRLMPGKRVVVCRTTAMEAVLRDGLNAVWSDEVLLWDRLASHVLIDQSQREMLSALHAKPRERN